jgi:hypothetical protein
MKRLLEEAEPSLRALKTLVESAEPHQPSPFAKRAVLARLQRSLESGGERRRAPWHVGLVGAALALVAGGAAAAGYALLPKPAPTTPALEVVPVSPSVSRRLPSARPRVSHTAPSALAPSVKRAPLPRPGEDPSQVAEAVRALRKQGDAARAQALLDEYLRANPKGALSEDALALSIEAAAARKDPRAADYARRYLARYPNGRFRGVAERALAR